ncbi:reverse transcriptase [Phytophthora megakarya]|uniref:Reverse transcriptase n=1 Tax=Phytophthora megakarya TaxID=4795 RepID=A0A225V4X4_9STRA|nr:reverse transcriptase [Phytophthora megakarya]
MARQIVDPLSKVAFAMSCLGGRARSWAYGRRLADPTCFSTYESFRNELKLVFELPKNEFRSRAEFFDLQQDTQDVHAYAQRARYLVSNVVTKPIDETTKVVTFVKGLKDGPVKTYLFREYPSTLEAAITLAMQEEFSLRQAKLHVNVPLPPEPAVEVVDEVEDDVDDEESGLSSSVGKLGRVGQVVRQQRLPVVDFEAKHVPRSQLEARLATGAIVKTEKRVIRAPFSYKHRVFVEELLVLDLDDKFDMVLGMPWLARHDPTIDWEKRMVGEDTLSAKTKKERFEEQSWDSLKSSPYYEILREHTDVLPDEIHVDLPQDKGIQHEIDLVLGSKYCVTRQWPLPREQVKAIDDFFDIRRKAGQVRESKSPHSAPTFCVRKPQDADTSKDVIIDSMSKSTIYSALDLRDGFYQILMRESDIPLTAVSTPSGMLWEWLVMPQGLKNAPATFNRCVTHLLRSVRDFAPSYFDDVYVDSRAVNEKTDVDMHKEHLRELLMRKHKLYANLKKCIFGASEIPVLGCLVGKNGVRPDPEKVRVINEWPTPNGKELRQFLGLATYLCKYVDNYAGKIRPLSQLLKKEAAW